jgi:hypothetical protein
VSLGADSHYMSSEPVRSQGHVVANTDLMGPGFGCTHTKAENQEVDAAGTAAHV